MASILTQLLKADATAVRKRRAAALGPSFVHPQQLARVDVAALVRRPLPVSESDWLAAHVVDFSFRIRILYGLVRGACSDASCPVMAGGPKYEYFWQDGVNFKKPTALSAPDYIDELFDWVDAHLNDESVFPRHKDRDFPKTFKKTCQKILSRLFRVLVHINMHHAERMLTVGAVSHGNTLLKHFYFFARENHIVEEREFEPLQELFAKIL